MAGRGGYQPTGPPGKTRLRTSWGETPAGFETEMQMFEIYRFPTPEPVAGLLPALGGAVRPACVSAGHRSLSTRAYPRVGARQGSRA